MSNEEIEKKAMNDFLAGFRKKSAGAATESRQTERKEMTGRETKTMEAGTLVYISGKMSGLPKEVYMARFMAAERALRAHGMRVCNPARFVFCRWGWLYRLMGYRLCLMIDLWMMSRCERIYLMPGWRDSCGARIESFAAWNLGVWRVPRAMRERIDEEITVSSSSPEKAQTP